MSDFAAFVPFVNRPDLLVNAVNAAACLHDDFTIIDNSPDNIVRDIKIPSEDGGSTRWLPPVKIFRPPVPFLFAQTMNWALEETLRRGKTFCMHMHNDAIIPEGACETLLEYVRSVQRTRSRWGVVFTHYDVLCAYNARVYEAIGGFDVNLPWYFSDNDYFRRMELAGWDKINSGIEVGHAASQTINSDPYLRHVNGTSFPLYREYYRAKWGGYPGEEAFQHPFGVLPKEWKLAKIS